MLTALILVCSIQITPDLRDCNASNARIVMRAPEAYASPAACAMQGQAYVAVTAMGRNLSKDDRVKVVCMSLEKADEALANAPSK